MAAQPGQAAPPAAQLPEQALAALAALVAAPRYVQQARYLAQVQHSSEKWHQSKMEAQVQVGDNFVVMNIQMLAMENSGKAFHGDSFEEAPGGNLACSFEAAPVYYRHCLY